MNFHVKISYLLILIHSLTFSSEKKSLIFLKIRLILNCCGFLSDLRLVYSIFFLLGGHKMDFIAPFVANKSNFWPPSRKKIVCTTGIKLHTRKINFFFPSCTIYYLILMLFFYVSKGFSNLFIHGRVLMKGAKTMVMNTLPNWIM